VKIPRRRRLHPARGPSDNPPLAPLRAVST